MGRHKSGKPRRGREMRYADDGSDFEGNPTLWINSAPRGPQEAAEGKPALCLITWGELEWYAPVAAVSATARDLATCAAYADLIGILLGANFEGHVIQGMLAEMLPSALNGRRPVMGGMLGHADTLGVMPAGSTERKAGVVMIKRGSMQGSFSAQGARQMSEHWHEAAAAGAHDELVGVAMADLLGAQAGSRFGAVLAYMAELRKYEGSDREAFRAEESERMRLIVGAPAE